MKTISKKTIIVFLSIGILGIIQSCKKELSPPDLFTFQISEIKQTSAVSRSVVQDDGGAEVFTRGVCWSTSPNPTTSSGKTVDRGGTGLYLSLIEGLTANTTYYVRAYAINSEGTNYGNELTFTTIAPVSGIRKSDIPGGTINIPTGFSIGNKFYVVMGPGDDPGDFLEWDQSTDIWTKKADYPGNSGSGAVGFSIGNRGYIGTGLTITGQPTNEFWEYDPVINKWTEKASLPFSTASSSAVGFSIGNKGYIGTGYLNNDNYNSNDFWEYDPVADNWTKKASLPGAGRGDAVGFSIGNKGYIGTGVFWSPVTMSYLRDFWEWDQETDIWTRKADFGGLSRKGAVGFSIGSKGYIGTGYTLDENGSYSYSRDFWEWDQGTNKWKRKADLEGNPRAWSIGVSIGDRGYIGAGIIDDGDWGQIINDFWEYDPDL